MVVQTSQRDDNEGVERELGFQNASSKTAGVALSGDNWTKCLEIKGKREVQVISPKCKFSQQGSQSISIINRFMTEEIQNLNKYDPFADTGDVEAGSKAQGSIHIRIQQRNGRKTLTTLQGLPDEVNQMKLLKAFKKEFACNGTIVQDEEWGEIIQLQGDQRLKIQQFLIQGEFVSKDKIKIHGF
ncbi:hypothetical protein SeMB42_g04744 [Synchytrium endobioticum]|uniref:SUI1 domain-containing protein n=1 Tax=Synchytrium endobioticum TaxID=286115 RepID=A0A507CVZ6_9FUNG|nr:hypothetical protein SeLEV6574_g05210 [Synchytrium endobioticum]TPX43377.1 hypothetical protein SeMB42_g04744 [Synchytrium endobioticum]